MKTPYILQCVKLCIASCDFPLVSLLMQICAGMCDLSSTWTLYTILQILNGADLGTITMNDVMHLNWGKLFSYVAVN